MRTRLFGTFLLAGIVLITPAGGTVGPGGTVGAADPVGRKAPGWERPEWVQGGPLSIESLAGKVVLVRWWTGPNCPYCRLSAPYLNTWHEQFAERGLVVVGLYHHKSSGSPTESHVRELVNQLGFEFPVAIDPEWRSLERWWLGDADRDFTSVTFLLDRDGVIRHVHAGGTYSKKEARKINSLLEEFCDIPSE